MQLLLGFFTLLNCLLPVAKRAKEIAFFLKVDVGQPHSAMLFLTDAGATAGIIFSQLLSANQCANIGIINRIPAEIVAIFAALFETSAAANISLPQTADRIKGMVAAIANTFPDNRTSGITLIGGMLRNQFPETPSAQIIPAQALDALGFKTPAAAGVPPISHWRQESRPHFRRHSEIASSPDLFRCSG